MTLQVSPIKPLLLILDINTISNDTFSGTATVTGWGLVSELDRKGSDYLQAANVNLLTPAACRNYKNFEEETQICAGYENGGTDACAVSLTYITPVCVDLI